MEDRKAQAIQLGEEAGRAYGTKLYQRGGIAAVAAAIAADAFEQDALDAFFSQGDEVHGELAAEPVRVHPYYTRAYCEVFARGARRVAEMFARGHAEAKAPKLSGVALLDAVKALFGHPYHEAVKAQLGDGASIEDTCSTLLRYAHQRALGDAPELIAAYDAGFAAGSV